MLQAVVGTFAAFAGTLAAYKFFNIQVGNKFRTFVVAAMFGMVALGLLEMVLGFFGNQIGLFGFGAMGLLFAVGGLVLGVFMLILDFDFVEKGVAAGLPERDVVACGVRADRQPGVDLHQPAADPRDLPAGLIVRRGPPGYSDSASLSSSDEGPSSRCADSVSEVAGVSVSPPGRRRRRRAARPTDRAGRAASRTPRCRRARCRGC